MTAVRKNIFIVCASVFLSSLAIAVYLIWPAGKPQQVNNNYELIPTDCAFTVDFDGAVECAHLRLPSPSQNNLLAVTVIKANIADGRASVPLLYFSGGPGAGVGVDSETIHDWLGWYELAGLKRDLILFDRRATGYSSPKHKCTRYDQFSREVLAKNLTTRDEMQQGSEIILDCFSRIKNNPTLARRLGTLVSSVDGAKIMQALGYSRWHIYGVSYGSRLAIVHADMYPENVESVILDSIYPPGRGILNEWPHLLEGALNRYFSYCQKLIECTTEFAGTGVEESFWLAVKSLRTQPVKLNLPDWQGGEITLLVNDHRFLSAVFSSLYDINSIKGIAPAINSILTGNKDALERFLTPFVNYALDESFNPWVYWLVECSENIAAKASFNDARQLYPKLAPYLEGVYEFDVCRQLISSGVVEYSALEVGVPQHNTLVIAGGLDPITPASWARQYRKENAHAQLWQLPNVGHAVLANSACSHAQLESFLQEGGEWHPKKLCGGLFEQAIKKAP